MLVQVLHPHHWISPAGMRILYGSAYDLLLKKKRFLKHRDALRI